VPVNDLAHASAELALWFGLALLAAKAGAEVAERVFRQPAVVGELIAGIAIGPYALGGVVLPLVGSIFPSPPPVGIAVPEPLWMVGQLAAVLLLFGAGLTTDFGTFVRFAPSALSVAVGGVIVPFVLGDLCAVALGIVSGPFEPEALFIGAILTATSVGVTARVLGDVGKLDTPEGATILGAAVIDDVIGVIVLAIVVASTGLTGGAIDTVPDLVLLAVRTVGLWLLFSAVLLAIARPLGLLVGRLRTGGAAIGFAVALAFMSGWVAEQMGLAMIIGAYSAGLALSRTEIKRRLESETRILGHALVPVFFVTMGMLVDLRAMVEVAGLGLLLTALAVVGKIVGGGIPALFTGFNRVGALRVGFGMVPRGEVALVVAGIGLAAGAVPVEVFGIGVMIAVLTTVITPFPLAWAFRLDGWGTRNPPPTRPAARAANRTFLLTPQVASLYEGHLLDTLAAHGYEQVGRWTDVHDVRGIELRREAEILSLVFDDTAAGRELRIESEAAPDDLDAILGGAAEAATAAMASALREVRT
jgi:Kef-type K+ transport system membrane component KefB